MSDANQEYFDAAVRHQVDIRRFTAGQIVAVNAILVKADRELVIQLRARLERLGLPAARNDFSAKRMKQLLDDIRVARAEVMRRISELASDNLTDLAKLEAGVETTMIEEAVPIEIALATVNLKTIEAIVHQSPFEGQILGDWFKQLSALDQQRLQQIVTMGIVNGENNEEIIRRVIGTRKAGYNDGILAITRRNAETIVRTAANHVSNEARERVWEDNSDIISHERWVSVLDGRTTPICQARDGQTFPVGEGPRPPAHFNCRSVMVGVLDGAGIVGERPFVLDTRRRPAREADFTAQAKEEAGGDWSKMSAKERREAVAAKRQAWQRENIGQVPAATTYQEWLGRQTAGFQDKVLGPKRGALFRKGGLKLSQFVDRAGNTLTLAELKALYPSAWSRALGG